MPRLGRRGMFFMFFRAVLFCFVLCRAGPGHASYHVVAGGVVARCVFSCRAARRRLRAESGRFSRRLCGCRMGSGRADAGPGSLRGVRVLRGGSGCAGPAGGRGCCTGARMSCGPGGAVCDAALHGMAGPAGGRFRTGRAEGPRLRMSVIFIIFAAVCRREVYGGGVS